MFPPLCAGCSAHLSGGCAVCSSCVRSISLHSSFFCGYCRARVPVINGSAELICHKRSSILLGAATSYSNPLVRSIVSSLKYERIHAAGEFLGLLLARYVWQTGINISDYAIVPMPIHAFRKYTRGYNQADKIAESFARRISCPVFSSMLIRTRHTKSQPLLPA